MKPRFLTLTLVCGAALAALAVPAKRGVVSMMTQPDGTVVQLSVVGDEHHHYYLTSDQHIVLAGERGYCYASVDADGKLVNTGVYAHDPDRRSASEVEMLSKITSATVRAAIYNEQSSHQNENTHDGNGLFPGTKFPTKGEVKALVFLVEYADVSFVTENASEYFHNLINQEGFSELGATGSARDYYVENSCGQFLPQFDVYGPVTLPNNRSYYGENNSAGSDKRPQYMMLHAAQILDEEVDFSQYDTDGDGKVDNVFIFYAGRGESDGGGADTVWPHQWEYSFSQEFDGVTFSRYACGSELMSDSEPDGIGTFCHEFGHVLGLPDLYNTNDAYVNYTPCEWDLMDQGCYNNNSHTPPAMSAFERNAVGWMGDNLIEITEPASVTLPNLVENNTAYVISTPRANEYFIFENRQKIGWDAHLPYHGMLIWHIDYNASAWRSNSVNNRESHQYVDLVEACNRTSSSALVMRKYPFPGLGNVTEFVFDGAPNFTTWAGVNLEKDITNICESDDGVITFDVAGGEAGVYDIVAPEDLRCVVDNGVLTAEADGCITVADMTGRVVAIADGRLVTNRLTKGIYIVSTATAVTKVMVIR